MTELHFSGVFDQPQIITQRGRVSSKLEEMCIHPKIRKRVLAIFVEMAQNIHRYSEHPDGGEITVTVSPTRMIIRGVNDIAPDMCESVSRRFDATTGLDKSQLRAEMRQKRRGEPTERGAGLGLLEIAWMSDVGLQWCISGDGDRPVLEVRAEVGGG